MARVRRYVRGGVRHDLRILELWWRLRRLLADIAALSRTDAAADAVADALANGHAAADACDSYADRLGEAYAGAIPPADVCALGGSHDRRSDRAADAGADAVAHGAGFARTRRNHVRRF